MMAHLVELRDPGWDTTWKGAHKPCSSLSTTLPVGEKEQEGQLGVSVGRVRLCPGLQELAANLLGWKWSGSSEAPWWLPYRGGMLQLGTPGKPRCETLNWSLDREQPPQMPCSTH